ncbi:MAG: helix-turn-helix domain-containing protein, partial [Acidobacteriaceae bacterium]
MAYQRLLSADDILNVAVRMVQQGGADSLSLRAVAAALGVKAPSLYRYFANKGALELAVFEE